MITTLRKNQKWLWIVIAFLAIPFCFYFVKTDPAAMRSDRFGRIYDQNISHIDYQRNARLFNLARDLGLSNYLQDLVAGAKSETEAYGEFTCNRLILQHEAEKFGIHPTAVEIADTVRTFQAFQGTAGFDMAKYTDFAQNALPAMGFNEAQIEELASDQITLNRIKELLASGVNVPETEMKSNYQEAFGKMDVTVVRFRNQDFEREINITIPDIAKYFETHKAELQTEPNRKVDFVAFGLTAEQKKLTGKERIDALQKLADRADDFTQALLEKGSDFKQAAAKFKATVQTTGDFSEASPDPLLKGNPQLAQTAFKLTTQEPNGDAVQTSDGFYILHLAGVSPARPLTLEEAKSRIVDGLKAERLHELMASKASEASRQIREKLKAGATADAAIQQAGLKPEKIPPFSLVENRFAKTEPKKDEKPAPDFPSIKEAVAELDPGAVSQFVPTTDGGLIAVLEKREPIDETQFAQARGQLEERYLQSMRSVVFYEWLRDRRADSGFQVAQG